MGPKPRPSKEADAGKLHQDVNEIAFRTVQADVSRIETGKTSAISLDVLNRLCRALKCEPGDILVRKGR